ncbi:hypothetical protein [Rhodococcus jostii]|uniref:Uncharacterized protein n=1 Tax=Rhodococcus jostii TaxID=132919 RepID=A0ABU4CSM7_RHOJO|nr:hypothetical protein [Rhodococcus jostii]MDV6286588.1 hypothetical protein [Rhodococcus jostii]
MATAEDAEADPRIHITEEQVRQRPDLWGVWVRTDTMYVDVESGEPVEEGDIHGDTFDDPDVEPEEELRQANSVEERDVCAAVLLPRRAACSRQSMARRRPPCLGPRCLAGPRP